MNPCEGRVPVSWNECADWLEWFGRDSVVIQRSSPDRWLPTIRSAGEFRRGIGGNALDEYRLLPPPGLVPAPEGMDGGGWLGQGKDVPDGWEWRSWADAKWQLGDVRPMPTTIVQCRPPAPKREPEWVPLTKLVGRTVWEFDVPVHAYEGTVEAMRWWPPETPYHMYRPFPDGTLDLDTGRVKVEPRATT